MAIQRILKAAGKQAPCHFLQINRQSEHSALLREMYGFETLNIHDQRRAVDFAAQIASLIAKHPDSNVFDLLECPGLKTFSNDLLAPLASKEEAFPLLAAGKRNPVYAGLQLLMMALPKEDTHVHISKSMHESEIAQLVIEISENDRRLMLTGLKGFSRYKDVLALAGEGDAAGLGAAFSEGGLLTKKRERKYEDFYVVSPFALEEAARTAAVRGLQDGVVSFNIRFNPAKSQLFFKNPVLTRDQWITVVRGTSEAVRRGIERALRDVRSSGLLGEGIDPKIGTMFSFSRDARTFAMHGVSDCLNMSGMARFCLEVAGDLADGLDISGPEYAYLDYSADKIDPWGEVLRFAAESGKQTTAHLGDMRFSDKSATLSRLSAEAERMQPGHDLDSKVIEMILAYLPYVERFIDIMPEGCGIGHGYIFDPVFLVSPLWGHGRLNGIDITQTPEGIYVEDKIRVLSQRAISKGLSIETCPAATLRETNKKAAVYEQLSLYRWLESGWKLKLGTDAGVFSFNRPRVLSETMTNLLLTRPAGRDPLTFRQLLRLVGLE